MFDNLSYPTPMNIVPCSLVLLVLLFIYRLILTRCACGLSGIPGPFLASFSNLWKIRAVYKRDVHAQHIELHKIYGPVVRIGPHHVSFASTKALHTIHGSKSAFAKSEFYSGSTAPFYEGKPLQNLFSLRDVARHASLKRNLANLYTKLATSKFEHHVDQCTMLLVNQLTSRIESGMNRFDMAQWLHFYALDSLVAINVSKTFGCLAQGTDPDDMLAKTDRLMHLFGLFAQAPFLQKIDALLKWMKGVNRKNNPLFMYTVTIVTERIAKPNAQVDMLNAFLDLHKSEPSKVGVAEIVGAIYINIMAGHDVLATSLRAIVYNLSRKPQIQAKLRSEIQCLDREYSPGSRIPGKELFKLKYLEAVVLEALRTHPITGLILEREVPEGGATIDGFMLPQGTIVGCNAWVIHRDTAVFGEDVDDFRPERWLNASQEKFLEMQHTIFTFGAGPRLCIGRNIAWLQMIKVVAELYRHFTILPAEPSKEWTIHGGWISNQTDMDMIIASVDSTRIDCDA